MIFFIENQQEYNRFMDVTILPHSFDWNEKYYWHTSTLETKEWNY
jgi:hypothetical protein